MKMVTESLKKLLNIFVDKIYKKSTVGRTRYGCPIYRMHGA